MFYFVKSQAFFVLFLYLLYGFKLLICAYCTYVVTPLFSDCPVYIKCMSSVLTIKSYALNITVRQSRQSGVA